MCHRDEDNQRRSAYLRPLARTLTPTPTPTPTPTLALSSYAYLRPLAALWRSSDPTLRHVLGLPTSAWRVVRRAFVEGLTLTP